MHVEVNGAQIYFDIEGCKLVPDGTRMREKPTLLLLHGGPGADHSICKPAFSALTDIAQVVYLDHRGNGRSTGNDPDTWNLAQWGDDVKAFCDTLGIEKPVVLGTSFGGFVAQSYMTRHPDHPAAVILVSTAAAMDFEKVYEAFKRIGGPDIRGVAEAYWSAPSPETRMAYREICLPYYTASDAIGTDWLARTVVRDEVSQHFNGPGNEQYVMDFRHELPNVRCPTLILVGEEDPITPPAFSLEIAECIPSGYGQLVRVDGAGHGVVSDKPEEMFALIRRFVAAHWPTN